MPEAQLRLQLPENVWIGELSRQYPDATFRILAALPDEQHGVSLTEIYSDSLSELLEDMRSYDMVAKLEVMNQTDERALVQFETTKPLLLFAVQKSGVPIEMPFELSDGVATIEIKAPSDRLSELSEQLETFGISFSIDYIQYEIDDNKLLTESQEEILEKALDIGYYDTPRGGSLTDIAAEVDRAKSTVSETLHRAEGKIIKDFAERTLRREGSSESEL